MKKTVSIIIISAILISAGILFYGEPKNNSDSVGDLSTQNVEIKNGVQYILVNAKAGYLPKKSVAQAGIPTKLIVKTNGTYDCSSSLSIRSIGYQKVLPQTGEEIIDLGTPQPGMLQGLCSMGMYNFSVNFK